MNERIDSTTKKSAHEMKARKIVSVITVGIVNCFIGTYFEYSRGIPCISKGMGCLKASPEVKIVSLFAWLYKPTYIMLDSGSKYFRLTIIKAQFWTQLDPTLIQNIEYSIKTTSAPILSHN